jgi:ribonuclease HII
MAGGSPKRSRKEAAARKRRNEQARERRRLKKLLALEASLWDEGVSLIAGVDEAGRGPLAGPVVAAAVVLPPGTGIRGVDDSKRLDGAERERLADEIWKKAVSIGIGAASRREVDRINILRASHLAMKRALSRLSCVPERVIVDGLPVAELGEHSAVVDGDARVHCIACASIIAKVTRDRLMRRLAGRYPAYHWETNVGYGTPEHREALEREGVSPHHRRSFFSVQLRLEFLEVGAEGAER